MQFPLLPWKRKYDALFVSNLLSGRKFTQCQNLFKFVGLELLAKDSTRAKTIARSRVSGTAAEETHLRPFSAVSNRLALAFLSMSSNWLE